MENFEITNYKTGKKETHKMAENVNDLNKNLNKAYGEPGFIFNKSENMLKNIAKEAESEFVESESLKNKNSATSTIKQLKEQLESQKKMLENIEKSPDFLNETDEIDKKEKESFIKKFKNSLAETEEKIRQITENN